MGRRGRMRALAALAIAIAWALCGGAATASAGTVTGVSAAYQGSRTAGDRAGYVTLTFVLETSLGSGQTITVRGPPGSDLTPGGTSAQLNLGVTGWALHNYRLSDGASTITFTLPTPVTLPVSTQLSLAGPRNPPLGGSYRWAVSTVYDSAGESQAVTIDPRPLSALTVTGGDDQRTPVTQPFGEPLQVRTSDDLGNPVAPAAPIEVTFTVSGGRAGATFPGGATSATVTSDASGVATAPALTANTAAGSFDVTAASAGLTGTSAMLRNGAGAPASIALTVTPPLVDANGFDAGVATAVIRDVHGNVVTPEDLTGEGPALSAAGGAETSSLAFSEAGTWTGAVFPTGSVGRSTVTAAIGALSASAPFDQALAPLLGAPSISGLSATGATVELPLDTRNAATSYHVEYGATTVSEQQSASLSAARDATPNGVVSIPLSGLAPQTTYVYRVVASNAIGRAQSDVRSFTTPAAAVDPPPGGGGGTPPGGGGGDAPPPGGGPSPRPGPAAAPRLSAVRLTPGGFAVRGRRAGATLRFTLDRAATVSAKVEASQPGVRVRGRCVAPGRRARGARCVRWRAAGTLSLRGRGGANSVRFAGRLGGRALAPGSYRLTLTPAGGSATTVAFTVKR